MVSRPKRNTSAFTSFRVIGKKAQELIAKAKKIRQSSDNNHPSGLLPPSVEPDIHISVNVGSVIRGTFAIVAILAGIALVFNLTQPILLLLLGFFVASVIDPGVRAMERHGVPRGIGILIQYCIALLIFFFLVLSLAPVIADQLTQIVNMVSTHLNVFLQNPQIDLPILTTEINTRLTEFMQAVFQSLDIHNASDVWTRFGDNISSFARDSITFAAQLAGTTVSFVVQLIIVMVLGFFIQIEKEGIRSWFCSFFSHRYRGYIDGKADAINHKIGQWARGQLILGLSIGILVFIALTILGMQYAVTLAALAAFTEFIPYIGPIIAAVPAVLIALTQEGMIWALIVAGVYYVIQWCENNLLVPLIMKRAVGLSPIAIIIAMLIGVSFTTVIHPILGILLAVPCTTIVTLFIEDWRITRSRHH